MNTEHRPVRQYVISENGVRIILVVATVLMIAVLAGIGMLATIRPQGRLVNVDTGQAERNRQTTQERLMEVRELDSGLQTIPINEAMRLVVERGAENPFGE